MNSISYKLNKTCRTDISNDWKLHKNDSLADSEKDDLRNRIGQLDWVSGQTRPDLAFENCQLNSITHHRIVDNLLKANKVLRKAKSKNIAIKVGLPGKIENFKILCYNKASLGNLKDGGSQGGFIIYLVGENNTCSPLMWQSKKLRRVVKRAIAAETSIKVEEAQACFWLANLIHEILYDQPAESNLAIEFNLVVFRIIF